MTNSYHYHLTIWDWNMLEHELEKNLTISFINMLMKPIRFLTYECPCFFCKMSQLALCKRYMYIYLITIPYVIWVGSKIIIKGLEYINKCQNNLIGFKKTHV